MADVALPSLNVDAVCFAKLLGGTRIEIGSAIWVATGEVENAVVWVADDVVGVGNEIGPKCIGLKRRECVLCYGRAYK